MKNRIHKYVSFFRLRMTMGLQYRAAAAAGVVTQFAWGFLAILAYHAFYRSDPAAFPMTLEATVNYIWMQQAFLALFMMWMTDNDIFEDIRTGNVAYELCRPADLYAMWFMKNSSTRLSRVLLCCVPILLVALFLPEGYRLTMPQNMGSFLLFLLSLLFGALVAVASTVLVYILTFFTTSPQGIRIAVISLSDFFCGFVIPLPFFPDTLRRICELLPFAAIGNVPLRVYSGDLTGSAVCTAIALQVFWFAVLVLLGRFLMQKALRRVVVQGG